MLADLSREGVGGGVRAYFACASISPSVCCVLSPLEGWTLTVELWLLGRHQAALTPDFTLSCSLQPLASSL